MSYQFPLHGRVTRNRGYGAGMRRNLLRVTPPQSQASEKAVEGTTSAVLASRLQLDGFWGYTPKGTPGLTCWLDAVQLDDTLANNDPVETWEDQSHAATNFTRTAGGSTRPTFITGWSSTGLPGVDFDGTDDYLETNAVADNLIDTTGWSVFVFAKVNSIGTDNADATAYNNDPIVADDNGVFGLHYRTTGPTMQGYGWDGNSDVAAAAFASATEIVAHFRFDGSTVYCSINGGTEATAAHGTTTALGADMYLGVNFDGSAYADMTVGEFVICDRAVSSTDIALAIAYLTAKWKSAGQTIAMSGAITPAAAVAWLVGKTATGSAATTGAITRATSKTAAGTVTPTGDPSSLIGKALTGVIASSGLLDTLIVRVLALAGSIASSSTVAKLIGKTATGTVASAGDPSSQVSKQLAGAVTPSGALDRLLVILRTFAGSVASAGAVAKLVTKTAAGSVTPTGDPAALVSKQLAGTITSSGLLDTLRTRALAVAGAITPAGVLAKLAGKYLVGDAAPAGTMARATTVTRTGATGPTGSLVKAVAKTLAGSISSSGLLDTDLIKQILVAGVIAPAGALTRATTKTLAGAVTSAATVAKLVGKTVTGTLTSSGALDAAAARVRAFAGTITPAGTLTRHITKALAGLLNPAGLLATLLDTAAAPITRRLRSALQRGHASSGPTVSRMAGTPSAHTSSLPDVADLDSAPTGHSTSSPEQ
ncbi:MAG: hypothetical protein ACKVWR_21910 [Acidimicrobiales bacterium]